jgi:arsenical pump membrane protein
MACCASRCTVGCGKPFPNLSVTGSLATILWLTALRRDGHQVGALAFLKVGIVVMSPALLLAIFAALAMG